MCRRWLFGREDQLDREALSGLAASIGRSLGPAAQLQLLSSGSDSEDHGELSFVSSRQLGGSWVLEGPTTRSAETVEHTQANDQFMPTKIAYLRNPGPRSTTNQKTITEPRRWIEAQTRPTLHRRAVAPAGDGASRDQPKMLVHLLGGITRATLDTGRKASSPTNR